MKLIAILAFASLAFVSCGASATGNIDWSNPYDHATRTEVKKADDKLQSQITQHGYEINTQAKYTTSVNEDLQASKKAGEKAYYELKGGIAENGKAIKGVDGKVDSLAEHVKQQDWNVQNQVGQLGEGIKEVDGKVNDLAAQGHAAYDQVQGQIKTAVGAQTTINNNQSTVNNNVQTQISTTNNNLNQAVTYQNTVNSNQSVVNSNQTVINNNQHNTNVSVQSQVNTTNATVAGHTTQIATIGDIANTATTVNQQQNVVLGQHAGAINAQANRQSALEDYSREMDNRLGGRLDSQQSQISSLKNDVRKAKEGASAALAVAGQQFCTGQECGFQVALSVATMNGSQAIAFGAGGAVSENVFINAALTKSGSTTGAVVSGTYRFK